MEILSETQIVPELIIVLHFEALIVVEVESIHDAFQMKVHNRVLRMNLDLFQELKWAL